MGSWEKPQSPDVPAQPAYENEDIQYDHECSTFPQLGAYENTGHVRQNDLGQVYSPNDFYSKPSQEANSSIPADITTVPQLPALAGANHTGIHSDFDMLGADDAQRHNEYLAYIPPTYPDPPHDWVDLNFDFSTLGYDFPGSTGPNLQSDFPQGSKSVTGGGEDIMTKFGQSSKAISPPSALSFKSDDEWWRATLARSRAADRSFLYGVRTTKIFCRPSCASRRPSRKHVEFFPFPNAIESAKQAGFRACKRCIPDTMAVTDKGVNGVVKALRLIINHSFEAKAVRPPTLKLEDLAREAGLSPFHFQRVFKATTQVTPGDFTTACQTLALQDALSRKPIDNWNSETQMAGVSGKAVADTLKGCSHWSTRTVKKALGGIPPTEYAAGAPKVNILYSCVNSPSGSLCIAYSAKDAIHSVSIGDDAVAKLEASFLVLTRSNIHEAALGQCIQNIREESRDRDVELPEGLLPMLWRARLWLKLVHDDIMG